VNRVIPDAEIEGFTDAFARRIAAFDKVALTGIKKLVDVATLPDDAEFAAALKAYFATAPVTTVLAIRCTASAAM